MAAKKRRFLLNSPAIFQTLLPRLPQKYHQHDPKHSSLSFHRQKDQISVEIIQQTLQADSHLIHTQIAGVRWRRNAAS